MGRIGARVVAGAAIAAAVSASACDWRDFDALAERTPVRRQGAPSDYKATNDFGRVVAPLPAPFAVAARYVVSAIGSPALAMVDLDGAGQPHVQALDPPVLSEGGAYPVTAMASAQGPSGISQVLLGAPASGAGRAYLMTIGPPPAVVLFASSLVEDRFGMGVASADLGGSSKPDLIVASATELHVYMDGDAAAPSLGAAGVAPCELALDPALDARYRLNRPVAVAGGVIAVGTPSATTFGSVVLFSVVGGVLQCMGKLVGTEGRFGQSLAVGDFDNNGTPDLLVGAPPRAAYLFRGPITAGSASSMISYADSAGQFGSAVAALNVDGRPGDEVLIADPDAVVGGQQAAGAVLLYDPAALAVKPTIITPLEAEGGAGFGASLGVLPFCAPPCPAEGPRHLALVGANTHTFTYFLLRPTDMDPRRF